MCCSRVSARDKKIGRNKTKHKSSSIFPFKFSRLYEFDSHFKVLWPKKHKGKILLELIEIEKSK